MEESQRPCPERRAEAAETAETAIGGALEEKKAQDDDDDVVAVVEVVSKDQVKETCSMPM